jgi:hypothetical protein
VAASAAVKRAWRSWNGPDRLHGIDLARALAVLGMFAAHLLTIEDPLILAAPQTWIGVVDGRSSILFAILAGVSIALVTGGRMPHAGIRLRTDRRRLAVRALLLWTIGLLLIQTTVPIYGILPVYGILFLLAIPIVSLPVAALWAIAGSVMAIVPWVLPSLDALPIWEGVAGEEVFYAIGWAYPFPLWVAFVAAGMAIGRTDLRSVSVQVILLSAGLAAAAVAGMASLAVDASGGALVDPTLKQVLSNEPHSGGIVEVVGSGGFAIAVLGACLLICRTPVTWFLLPLRAIGSMPRTAYVAHVLVWAVAAAVLVGDPADLFAFRELQPFWWFVLGIGTFCFAWASTIGQGPLERGLVALSRRFVSADRTLAADRVDR